MTNQKPTASDVVDAMILAATEAATVRDMPATGTFAQQYGDAHREDVTPETVQAFVHGTTVINLLVQESILKVTRAAAETAAEQATTEEEQSFAAGVQEGAMLIAQIMAATADQMVYRMVEGVAFDREFQHIVQNF